MTVSVGDRIPELTLKVMGEKGPENIAISDIFKGKKVVMFAVPGAFTPGCSVTHLPGYVVNADKIKAKGVDSIVCTAVNDAFVMGAWGKDSNANELIMLADGNAEFAKALGLTMDGSGFGLGLRSQRYAMIVEDGVIKHLAVEPEGGVTVSSAEEILKQL